MNLKYYYNDSNELKRTLRKLSEGVKWLANNQIKQTDVKKMLDERVILSRFNTKQLYLRLGENTIVTKSPLRELLTDTEQLQLFTLLFSHKKLTDIYKSEREYIKYLNSSTFIENVIICYDITKDQTNNVTHYVDISSKILIAFEEYLQDTMKEKKAQYNILDIPPVVILLKSYILPLTYYYYYKRNELNIWSDMFTPINNKFIPQLYKIRNNKLIINKRESSYIASEREDD